MTKSCDTDDINILKWFNDFNPKTTYLQLRVDYFKNGMTLSSTFKFNTGMDFRLIHICLYVPRKKKDKDKRSTFYDYFCSGTVLYFMNILIFLNRFFSLYSFYFLVFLFIELFYKKDITLGGFLIWILRSDSYCEEWRSWKRYKSLMCTMILFIITVRVDCPR
jgi:hypothetical protein